MANWKDSLVQYFAEGIKEDKKRIGLEVEHFIVDKNTKEAVPYEGEKGIREILYRLMDKCPDSHMLHDDDFFGFAVPEFVVTLEPAAQLEVSIIASHSVDRIVSIYERFKNILDEILDEYGYEALNVGCQPKSRVRDLKLIPKRRYDLMNAHFAKTGTGGIEMMRGSASVQTSIDYSSEGCFRNKMQAAYYYSPMLKILTDNAEVFEGKKIEHHLKRADIWRRTDANRCGIIPGIFKEDFGFADYAEFIGNMLPIFMKEGNDIFATGYKTVREIFNDQDITRDEVIHVISMAFPDVRLKQFIEVRYADSMPEPFIGAYCALIKGLLNSEEGIRYAKEQIRTGKLTEKDIIQSEDSLIEKGWDGNIYGRPAASEVEKIIDLAVVDLPEEEKKYLEPFRKVILFRGISNIPEE